MRSKQTQSEGKDERLEQLGNALKEAQLLLLQQARQLDALRGEGDAPSDDVADAREQLAIVTAERDQLQKQLLALERLQTATIALPESEPVGSGESASLPTIEELIQEPGSTAEDGESTAPRRRFNGPAAEAPEADLGEMISPEVIAPDAFGPAEGASEPGVNRPTTRMLVEADSVEARRVPLHEGTMTIGRSDTANIRIDGPYVSRIHARIICRPDETLILDAGSKNGLKVNSVAVERHALVHGDVITLGSLRFTFVDTAEQT